MKKILPMGDPIIDSYCSHGSGLSILGAHTDKHLPWVYNFFVQMYTPPRMTYGNRLNYAVPDMMKSCPWLKSIYIDRSLILDMVSIMDLIKNYINHEYYFYACYEVSQIAVYKRDKRFNHELLIYGYDDEKAEVYFADNYRKGKYSHGIASYEEIEKATKSYMHSNYKDGFRGVRYVEENDLISFQFDKETYINLLVDYIEQRDSSWRWLKPGTSIKTYQGRNWGIGVYPYVQEYLRKIQEEGREIDIRGFYVIKEHKFILEKSLTYVLGEEWKSKYTEAWQLLETDINMATILLNLCLKYNVKHEDSTLEKIRDCIRMLEINERKLFPCIINILKTSQVKASEAEKEEK